MLHETEVVLHTENDVAPVAYLRIKRASLHPKESSTYKRVEIPPLLKDKFADLKDTIETSAIRSNGSGGACTPPTVRTHHVPDQPSIRAIGPWLAVGNIHTGSFLDSEMTMDHEVRNCFLRLQGDRFAN